MVFDAVRARLIEIGEAVRSIDDQALAAEPIISWVDIAGMSNHLAHRYFDTSHSIIQATIDHDIPPMRDAIERIRASTDSHPVPLSRSQTDTTLLDRYVDPSTEA